MKVIFESTPRQSQVMFFLSFSDENLAYLAIAPSLPSVDVPASSVNIYPFVRMEGRHEVDHGEEEE